MAKISTISYPGVEYREYDESLRATTSAATVPYVVGFASQGPVEEVMQITDIADFETIYGKPTNAAEKYFYYTVKAQLAGSSAGTILTSRLPYGLNAGDNVSDAYTILAYPAIPVVKNPDNTKGYDYFEIGDCSSLLNVTDKAELTVAPKEVETNMVLTSEHPLTKVKITGLSLTAPLPSVNDTTITYESKPTLTWTHDSNVKETATGVVGMAEKDGDSILQFAFALVADGVQVGILYIDATYTTADFKGKPYNSLSLNSVTNANITCEEIKAHKIGDYFSVPVDKTEEELAKIKEDYSDVTYLIGAPVTFNISYLEYANMVAGEMFEWSNTPYTFGDIEKVAADPDHFGMLDALSHSAFIVINSARGIVNDNFEGCYFGITDNIFNTPDDDLVYNSIKSVKITTLNSAKFDNGKGILDTQFQTMVKGRLDFYLDSNNKGSLSQVLQGGTTAFDTDDKEFDDTVNLAVFKLTKSTTANEILKLSYGVTESLNASFGRTRQYSTSESTSPRNYFIETLMEPSSSTAIIVNSNIAENIRVDSENNLRGKIRFYSTKLLSNLAHFEKKYISKYSATPIATNNNKSLTAVARIAKSNIHSWADIVMRAGVSSLPLSQIAHTDADTKHKYYNFELSDGIYPFGTYTVTKSANKYIGNLPQKLNRALSLVRNDETWPDIDIIPEGGLGTVYAYAASKEKPVNPSMLSVVDGTTEILEGGAAYHYDDTVTLQGVEDLRTGRSNYSDLAQEIVDNYMSVQNEFLAIANSFTNGGRGDCFFVNDVLRGVLLKGKSTKVESLFGQALTNNSYDDADSVNHSFSTSIYWPVRHLYENIVSSYASAYNQWFKINDEYTGEKIWVPTSGYVAANMLASDALYGPWKAAAGMNRGVVSGVLDVAFSPTDQQVGELYKLSVNSIVKKANSGIVIWGIRTLSKKASAFDQNTCRRTFLYMEKNIKRAMRWYVFETNDVYTRLQIYNELYPFLDSVRKNGGIYSFTLTCDETNNTPEIINNGDLAVDFSAAPTRTAEHIIVSAHAKQYEGMGSVGVVESAS